MKIFVTLIAAAAMTFGLAGLAFATDDGYDGYDTYDGYDIAAFKGAINADATGLGGAFTDHTGNLVERHAGGRSESVTEAMLLGAVNTCQGEGCPTRVEAYGVGHNLSSGWAAVKTDGSLGLARSDSSSDVSLDGLGKAAFSRVRR